MMGVAQRELHGARACEELMASTCRLLCVQALHRITQNAIMSISVDRHTTGIDVDAIAKVLKANAMDADMLSSCVEAISVCEGGEAVLWEVVSGPDTTQVVSTEVLRMLAMQPSTFMPADVESFRMMGVLQSVARAMATVKEANGSADEPLMIEAAKTTRLCATQLLNAATVTPEAASMLNAEGGLVLAFQVRVRVRVSDERK
jgi:hypothetical protein